MLRRMSFILFSTMIALFGATGWAQETTPLPVQSRSLGPKWPGMQRTILPSDFDYSADKAWFVVVSSVEVRQIPVATKNEHKVLPLDVSANTVCCSPVAKDTFAVGQHQSLVTVYKIGADKPSFQFAAHQNRALQITGLEYSPDGKRLAVSGKGRGKSPGFYSVRDALTGEELFGATLATSACGGCIAFSQDGRFIAITGKDPKTNKSQVRMLSATDGTEQRRLEFSPGFANGISFTPDGKRLVVAGGHCVPVPNAKYPGSCKPTGYIWLADVDSTAPMQRITPANRHGYFVDASVTADGKSFFTVSAATSQLSAQLRSTTTGQVVSSHSIPGSGAVAAILSPDKKTASILGWHSLTHLNAADGTLQPRKN